MNELTPAKRVEISLHMVNGTRSLCPLYENKISQCVAERQMPNRGLCIVKRDAPAERAESNRIECGRGAPWGHALASAFFFVRNLSPCRIRHRKHRCARKTRQAWLG